MIVINLINNILLAVIRDFRGICGIIKLTKCLCLESIQSICFIFEYRIFVKKRRNLKMIKCAENAFG